MTEHSQRRPLSSRDTGWARALARKLTTLGISPNAISIAAVGFAAVGCVLFALSGQAAGGVRAFALLGAALCCQLRLICNLMDGMVALEGGRATKDGGFWNEVPDRIADILFIAGAGYAVGDPALGWAAASFAVLTAYVREFGRAEGFAPDYRGPMAKPQRMALLTVAAVIAAAEPLVLAQPITMTAALWLLIAGAAATSLTRARRIIVAMNRR